MANLAPTHDIARWSVFIHHDGIASGRCMCDGALKELYFVSTGTNTWYVVSVQVLLGHQINYRPGVVRKALQTSCTISTFICGKAHHHPWLLVAVL
ncbi:hypothetical protein EMCRGX_G017010 [Ephydatia muelleri]